MMTEYDEFQEKALYALARNGGSLNLSDFRDRSAKGMDALDYQLHLRQLQDEKLVVRGWTEGSSLGFLMPNAVPARPYVELTAAGWDWVRERRAAEKLAKVLAQEPPSSDPGV